MSVQTGAVSLVALAVEADPSLQPGIRLRWAVDPAYGFPPLGFDLFRRTHATGPAQALEFTGEPEAQELPQVFERPPTRWSTGHGVSRASIVEEPTTGGTVRVLRPAVLTAMTCRFAAPVPPLCLLELDVVHWAPVNRLPADVTVWGIAGGERVRQAAVRLTDANRRQVQTVAVTGDALEGFQIPDLGGLAPSFGILRVRWVRVADADGGWGQPLNPRRIGLPLTAPGYLVPHAHGPDPGDGSRDWQEAADRMSPTGAAAQLPPTLTQRFGPPVFAETRQVMREALARRTLQSAPTDDGLPRAAMDPVRLLLLGSVDPDFARLLGLARIDATAVPGHAYDYKIVGYWPGELRPQLVCVDVPAGGATTPPGTTVTLPGPSGTAPVTASVATPAATTTASAVQLAPSLSLPPGLDLRTVPGLVVRPGVGSGFPPATLGPVTPAGTTTPLGPATPVGPALAGPAQRRSFTFRFARPTDVVRVVAASAGPEPLVVVAIAGDTVVAVRVAAPGAPTEVTLDAPGTTSVVVSGTQTTVTVVCRVELVRDVLEEAWISFDVVRDAAPAVPIPDPPQGQALPGFAREGGPEQVVGLTLERRPPPPAPWDLLPLARRAHDPIVYELERRVEGDQPLTDPTAGPWTALRTDPATGHARPLLRSTSRPPAHRAPPGWPVEAQDFIDDGIDPNVRHYGYRVRGRDLFGRRSGWSAPTSVDAADRVPPPSPDGVTARWIETSDRWLAADDAALLAAAGVTEGVRARWAWPQARRRQAPDTAAFRIYWHGRSFATLTGAVTPLPSANGSHRAEVAFPALSGVPPQDAFAGDWLRQRGAVHRIIASTAANPTTLALDPTDVEPPVAGPGVVSLRAPDPARLDLRGNPLRPDTTAATAWERRVLQVGLVSVPALVVRESRGVTVTITKVEPRSGVADVTLKPSWRWAGELPDGLELEVDARRYPVVGGSVGIGATLLVRVETAGDVPPLGDAVLAPAPGSSSAPALRTLELDAVIPQPANVALLGGTVWDGTQAVGVLAHAAGPARLAVTASPAGATVTWLPDYEVLLANVALPVSAAAPQASGAVGVSALDSRPYAADRRGRPGEPGGPGNEGPVAAVALTRAYRGAPTRQPAPEAATGTAELWAPLPDEFSGTARFELRWAAGIDPRFTVEHATLDAVLDSAAADRAAGRGAYAGQTPISGTALTQWRAQQAGLPPQGLQALATQQKDAFRAITPTPLKAAEPAIADPQPGWLRWPAPLDGHAPGRHFLRVRAVDQAGNPGPLGPATLPIVVPDGRRPRPPQLRQAIGADHAVWLLWDASDATVAEYRIYRARLAAGASPGLRDMTLVATLPQARCPEPVAVFGGEARLPGPKPAELVAVYRAEDYDPQLAPAAQTAAPVAGATITDTTIGNLDSLPDGSLVFAVVRYTSGGQAALAAPATGRAWRDPSVQVGVRHQYRVEAIRQATVGPNATTPVRSFPSDVAEAAAFDPRPPVPPAGTVAWIPAEQFVRITWPVAGLSPGTEVLVERMDVLRDRWEPVGDWTSATTASVTDTAVTSGHTYAYRLRARNLSGRISEEEPVTNPLSIP